MPQKISIRHKWTLVPRPSRNDQHKFILFHVDLFTVDTICHSVLIKF